MIKADEWNQFCPVRFREEPLSGRMEAQCRMTWGETLKRSYHDYWGWTADVRFMRKKSVARPVIMGIISFGDKPIYKEI